MPTDPFEESLDALQESLYACLRKCQGLANATTQRTQLADLVIGLIERSLYLLTVDGRVRPGHERALFEAFAQRQTYQWDLTWGDDGYNSLETRHAWKTWVIRATFALATELVIMIPGDTEDETDTAEPEKPN